MFQELKEILSKKLKENMRMIIHQRDNIYKEKLWKSQIDILEFKNTIVCEKLTGEDQQPKWVGKRKN